MELNIVRYISAYYMAVGGTAATTKEKHYSMTSPMVNVSNNTCVSFEIYLVWEKNKKPHGMLLSMESVSEAGKHTDLLEV